MTRETLARIQFRDVSLGYGGRATVRDLSGDIAEGALLAVVGPNGAGKSTLFRGIVGALRPLSGTIVHNGIDARDIAYLPQTADIDRSFPISVFDFVATGLWRSVGWFGGFGEARIARIHDVLIALGIGGVARNPIGALSGGQMQRMLFARVVLQDASVIVLDEPFNAIDVGTSEDLLVLIHRWHGEGRTVLAALHDMDVIRRHFPQTLLLAHRAIAWGVTDDVLTDDNLLAARLAGEADDAAAWRRVA
jgi:zinc/manganese transport system ATP-binding protein